MSLLLDALKRAEQEKLARHGERGAAEIEAANAAHASPIITSSAAALELAPLASPPGLSAPRMQTSAQAAQTVFQAKKPPEQPGGKSRVMLWVSIVAIALVVVSAGAYVWFSISALTPRAAPAARVRPPPLPPTSTGSVPPPPAGGMFAVPSQPPQAARPTEGSAAVQSPFTLTPPPTAPAASPFAPAASAPGAAAPPVAPKAASLAPAEQAAAILDEAPRERAAPPLRLSRSNEAPRISAEVSSGYDALRDGNLALARRSYQAALAADAVNLDALLGLATAEARLGNRATAASLYRRSLEVDPRNATALAGLASLSDLSRPEGLETQLRSDVSRYPDSAPLHFTLGNLYASQARWRDAQSEFFEAHRLEPFGADILYNLAVSLDNLGQSKLAADYYRRALEAARGQPIQFDPAPVSRRIAELKP